jgi:chemotaxis protein MotB
MKQQGEVFKTKLDALKRQLESLKRAKHKLQQMIESDPRLNNFKSNLLLTLTQDGLLIQITDSQQRPMFKLGSEHPEPYMFGILEALVPLLNELTNAISLTGHTDSLPYAGGVNGYSNWELSAGRANATRRVLVNGGLADDRFLRVIGTAHRMPLEESTPADPRNRRISILVLSQMKEQEIQMENTLAQQPDALLQDVSIQPVQGYSDGIE